MCGRVLLCCGRVVITEPDIAVVKLGGLDGYVKLRDGKRLVGSRFLTLPHSRVQNGAAVCTYVMPVFRVAAVASRAGSLVWWVGCPPAPARPSRPGSAHLPHLGRRSLRSYCWLHTSHTVWMGLPTATWVPVAGDVVLQAEVGSQLVTRVPVAEGAGAAKLAATGGRHLG